MPQTTALVKTAALHTDAHAHKCTHLREERKERESVLGGGGWVE